MSLLRRIFKDLGWQLSLLYLALVVPFFFTLLLVNQFALTRIRQDVTASDQALVSAIAQETGAGVKDSLEAVQALASFPEVESASSQELLSIFRVFLPTHPNINLVYRLSAAGEMLYHYPEGPGSTVGESFAFREYFRRALQVRTPFISAGRISPTTNQPVATAVMPIWLPSGEFDGLVGANLRLESLSETLRFVLNRSGEAETLQVVILDSSGQVIASPQANMLLRPAADLLPNLPWQAAGGSQIATSPLGEERLYTYAPVEELGWLVIVSRPVQEAFASQDALQRITISAALTLVFIGLLFWGGLSNRVLRPLEKLVPFSEALGANQPIEPEDRAQIVSLGKRKDQVGDLVSSILNMEQSIAARFGEQALLLEISAAVVSSLDLPTVLETILRQMSRLLGVQKCAIIALDEKQGVFRIRASLGLSERHAQELRIQPGEPDSVTLRALYAREPIYVSDTETDPSYVTRRQLARAEGYRAVLAAPLRTQYAPPTTLVVFHTNPHHFTHNELQLLSTLANQAAMAIENALLFERSDTRLQAQTRRLEALMQSMQDGLILTDLAERVQYVNPRALALTSLEPEALQGKTLEQALTRFLEQTSIPETARSELQQLIHGQRQTCEITLEQNSQPRHLRVESFTVQEEDTSLGRGVMLRDVTSDREVDRMKASLISTVSHELRTPLASIKGYTSTLLAEDVNWNPEAQREFLNIILQEADSLTELVNNLLDLSRLEAGSLRLAYAPCSLPQVIAQAARRAGITEQSHFRVSLPPQLPPLLADPARLETILRNLLENALKHAGENAHIGLRVRVREGFFRFEVCDDGPGIPPPARSRVFERFYQAEAGLTRAGGAGLGLAICMGLVGAHGGEIWLEHPARGLRVCFTIPAPGGTTEEETYESDDSPCGG